MAFSLARRPTRRRTTQRMAMLAKADQAMTVPAPSIWTWTWRAMSMPGA